MNQNGQVSHINQFSHKSQQSRNVPAKGQKFEMSAILAQITHQDDLSIQQLQNQIRQVQMSFKETSKQLSKLKRQIQLRPNSGVLMQNTILITTSIHSDPQIIKLLHTRETDKLQHDSQDNSENKNQFHQLKQVSSNLGKKLSQISDCLPLLLGMIKNLQKQKNAQIFQLNFILEEKVLSLQEQIQNLKNQQLSQKLASSQKMQQSLSDVTEKIRQFQTKQTWQVKQVKNKLQQKISKQVFDRSIQRITDETKNTINKFQEESTCLVNPEKIKQIQKLIKQNKQTLTKAIIQCEVKIQNFEDLVQSSLVKVEFYKKQRTSLQKRISTTNQNLQQFYGKVSKLITSEQTHEKRLEIIQKQNRQKIMQLANMKKVLNNLHITEQFQKMLSKIDPDKILQLQAKIQSLDTSNKSIYKQINATNRQIDKISSKFDVSGVLIPNKARDKEFQLNDLRELIDEYFIENRFASKIGKMQSQIMEGKSTIQAIKLLQKKIARLQKENDYAQIIEEFRKMQVQVKRDLKIFQEKISSSISHNQVSKSYYDGLFRNASQKKLIYDLENDQMNGAKRKSLVSQSSTRKDYVNSKLGSRNSNSLKKCLPLQTLSKQLNSTFLKNTISSTRKNLLKTSDILTK